MKYIISALILFFFSLNILQAQVAPKEFPEDDAAFIKALGDYVASNNRQEAKILAVNFQKSYPTGVNTAENLPVVKNIAKLLLQKKATLYPQFYLFVQLLQTTTTTQHDPSLIKQHFALAQKILSSDGKDAVKQFFTYVDYLQMLFSGTDFYSDKAKKWSSEAPYTLSSENNLPVLVFNKTKITAASNNDTLIIQDVTGKFYPFTNEWVGASGKITWRRNGLDESKIYATFGKHSFNLTQQDVKIDSAVFSFQPYVDKKMTGVLTDKISPSKAIGLNFPQFTSYEKVELKGLSAELDFESGITVEGKKLFATGFENVKPVLYIKNNKGVVMVEAKARRFLINNFETIDADNAYVKYFFIDKEKPIFHPCINFNYVVSTKTLKTFRENKAEQRSPFMSDYFKFNIYIDQIEWKTDSTFANFNSIAANAQKTSTIESYDYYTPGVENKFRAYVDFDPLGALKKYCDDNQTRIIPVESVADLYRAGSPSVIETYLYRMMEEAYVYYDKDEGYVHVFDKLMLHVDASAKLGDYDNIRFNTQTVGKAGKILFDKKEIEIYGVKQLSLSSSKNVIMRPTSDTVYLSENRGITLKGMLTAGKVNFYSQRLVFSYENFEFKMMTIDSMLVMVPMEEKDSKGRQLMREINTPIQSISGSLFIDDPSNKAGIKSDPKYPFFTCNDTAYIYYDKAVKDSIYPRKSFYFEVFPFQYDSMNTFLTENLRFPGRFVSADIFKPFQTDMSIQKDLTLGFNIATTDKGLEIFNGKGIYYDSLFLDNSGLKGNGRLVKSSLEIKTPDLRIFPDSLYAIAESFSMSGDKKSGWPELKATQGKIFWKPSSDSLLLRPEDEQFAMHNNTMQLKGSMDVYGKKLLSRGKLNYANAEMEADEYQISLDSTNAFLKSFDLKESEGGSTVMKAQNLLVGLNVTGQSARFTTTDSTGFIALPASQLQTKAKDFNWNINAKNVDFKNPTLDQEVFFECLNSSFKGIKTTASESIYDLQKKTLLAKGVSQVLVADSKVIPDGNQMEIDENGSFKPFENATVVLNADSNYHVLNKATVNVNSSNNMSGTGMLAYKTAAGEVPIKVENFETASRLVEKDKNQKAYTKYYVKAKGLITEEDNYFIDSKIRYKGDVLFSSESPELTLNGFAKLEVTKDSLSEWFAIQQGIDLSRKNFDIDSLQNEYRQGIFTGIAVSMETFEAYPMLMRAKTYPNDRMVYQAKGVFRNGPEADAFSFGDENIVDNPKLPGSLLKYSDATGVYDITGDFSLINLSPAKFATFGSTRYSGSGSPLLISGTLAFDYYLAPELMNEFNRFVLDNTAGGTGVVTTGNKPMARAFYHLIPNKDVAAATVADMDKMSMLNLPADFGYNLVLSDVKLKFDQEEGTFKSVDKVSLMVFGYKTMLVKVDAYIEVGPRPGKDFVNIYLQFPNGQWLFLRYVGKELGVVTSDAVINDYLAVMKADRKVLKQGKEIIYEYMPATPALKDNFVSRMMDYKERNP